MWNYWETSWISCEFVMKIIIILRKFHMKLCARHVNFMWISPRGSVPEPNFDSSASSSLLNPISRILKSLYKIIIGLNFSMAGNFCYLMLPVLWVNHKKFSGWGIFLCTTLPTSLYMTQCESFNSWYFDFRVWFWGFWGIIWNMAMIKFSK